MSSKIIDADGYYIPSPHQRNTSVWKQSRVSYVRKYQKQHNPTSIDAEEKETAPDSYSSFDVVPHLYRKDDTDVVVYALRDPMGIAHARDNWPPTGLDYSLYRCRSCSGTLDLCVGDPFPIPERYDPVRKTFSISNILTHGPRCAARYLKDRLNTTGTCSKLALVWQMARELFHIAPSMPAPELTELEWFGGPLTIQEYLNEETPLYFSQIQPESMVPSYVVTELRFVARNSSNHLGEQSKHAVQTDDISRYCWQIKNLKARPPHLPTFPVVNLQPSIPTIFDQYVHSRQVNDAEAHVSVASGSAASHELVAQSTMGDAAGQQLSTYPNVTDNRPLSSTYQEAPPPIMHADVHVNKGSGGTVTTTQINVSPYVAKGVSLKRLMDTCVSTQMDTPSQIYKKPLRKPRKSKKTVSTDLTADVNERSDSLEKIQKVSRKKSITTADVAVASVQQMEAQPTKAPSSPPQTACVNSMLEKTMQSEKRKPKRKRGELGLLSPDTPTASINNKNKKQKKKHAGDVSLFDGKNLSDANALNFKNIAKA